METLRGTDDGKRPEQWPSGRIWPCFAQHANQASQSSGMPQDSSVELRVGQVPDKPQGLPDSSWVPHPQPRPGSSLLLDFLQCKHHPHQALGLILLPLLGLDFLISNGMMITTVYVKIVFLKHNVVAVKAPFKSL